MSKLANVLVFSDLKDRYAELLAAATQLSDNVTAAVFGSDDDVAMAARQGASCVYALGEKASQPMVENYAETLAAIVRQCSPQPTLLLFSATKRCKALAARLSVLLDVALVNDATTLSLDAGGICVQHRLYGGLAFGNEVVSSPLAIVTLMPGVFEPLAEDPQRQAPVVQADYVTPANALVCKERRAKQGSSVDLSKAKRVVGIGRGLAAQDDLKMVQALADVLEAELGCSRPIAEGEHWMERERYIGVSGVLLKADLYLALGISGQIQHMVGGNGARTIVAINKDKNAPIFQFADYGLVGDIYKVVPALVEQLKR